MTTSENWKPANNSELDAWGRGYLTGWERGYADAIEAAGLDKQPVPANTGTSTAEEN